jgi:thiamine biosynthesis protein ThiS
MKILLNGKETEIRESLSLQQLLMQMGVPLELIACEVNLKIIKRNQYALTLIQEGDQIEVLQMIGGG